MSYIIAGLGNPGEKYLDTRHNTGRMVLENFLKIENFPDLENKKKFLALISEGKLGKAGSLIASREKVILVEPDAFMNKSGISLKTLVKNKKQAEKLVVIYDDIDIPLGKFKISFNRGSGGHNGIKSIIRNIKTKEFIRIRVGVSPTTPSGKIKKPKGEDGVIDFILGKFKPDELKELKKISKKISQAIKTIILDGRAKAMGEWN